MAFRTKQVELGCVVATVLWTSTFALATGGSITAVAHDRVTPAVMSCALFTLLAAAAACTATIRSYFVRMDRKVDQFFEMGRTYGGGAGGTVRRMRD